MESNVPSVLHLIANGATITIRRWQNVVMKCGARVARLVPTHGVLQSSGWRLAVN
jgi:hypothetical protein